MGVSALRIAACAGLLLCGLILSTSAGGLASADPDIGGHGRSGTESSKEGDKERPSLNRIVHRILSEQRKRLHNESRTAPRAKIGSEPDTGSAISESSATPLDEPDAESASELAPADDRERGSGSDDLDNTVVSSMTDAAKKPSSSLDYFPFYLLELRRDGGDWWNAQRVVSRLGKAIDPYLARTREPHPEPEPVPAPAFRGPAPAAPAPEPVLDASGGVVGGGGSDYRATGFAAAPVLSAPVVAMSPPPPAAARFPAFPPAPAPAPGVGPAARGAGAERAVTTSAVRQAGGPNQGPSNTVSSMSEQVPRRGYADSLRRPGLPQLAGAALPGVAGILLMTFAGGVVGYRQASAGRMLRFSAAARYLP